MTAVFRIDTPDGAWETLGAEEGRFRGIVAEEQSIEATADEWGPLELGFTIKAPKGSIRPDLLPYSAIEYEQDGMLVWAGRIRERGPGESQFQVRCRGWQFHLDDDLYDRAYVHTRLSDYRDQRTFLGADLTRFTAVGQVANDNGVAVIGWPNGTPIVQNNLCGITLDLGPDSVGKRAVIEWDKQGTTVNETLWVRAHTGENPLTGSTSDALSFTLDAAPGFSAGTFFVPYRYISIFIERTGGSGTFGTDVTVRLKSVRIFRDTSYESGNASVLKADTVIKDARDAKAPLLDDSNDLISTGTFSIPEYVTGGYQSPRQVIEAVNAYENFQTKIGGRRLNALVFRSKPSVPLFEVGEWSGAEFADSSINGDEIYDTAIVDATGPDGSRLVSTRTQAGTLLEKVSGLHRARALPISSALTQAVADRFGDLWLTEHQRAPFAGTLSRVSDGDLRRHRGGVDVPAHELLLFAGEKIRFGNLFNPDTGGWGRDGRIAGVTYRPGERLATIAIDDRRDQFEKVLSRFGLLVDQLRR